MSVLSRINELIHVQKGDSDKTIQAKQINAGPEWNEADQKAAMNANLGQDNPTMPDDVKAAFDHQGRAGIGGEPELSGQERELIQNWNNQH